MNTYNYCIHDLICIHSQQRLPELAYFRTETPLESVDIDVRVARRPSVYRRDTSIFYQEVLGDAGFSMVVNRGETHTEVIVSPLIGRSPHVLYTNVVEPLLRWALVRKGYALMHGACLSFGGKALFITAKTDTGKTTTILHTVRGNQTCRFLSDDMTIFTPGGEVLSYPKPLTISQHTVQAVGGAPLTRREKAFLELQSRLHSRGGRRVGMWLSNNKTPAATLNALVQMLIPPPKYSVERLVPGTRYAKRAILASLVLIERGTDDAQPIPEKERVDLLLANADDAYGFPPYPVLADALSSWQGENLHKQERAIVAKAIEGLPAVRLQSTSYEWYKHLPHLVTDTKMPVAEARVHTPFQSFPHVSPSGD